MRKASRPHGSWPSPVTTELIVSEVVGLTEIRTDGDDLYWIEQRPSEKGRCVIQRRRPDGAVEEVLPAPFSARSRVHEYGGGAYLVDHGTLYFSNFVDQRLYRLVPGAHPTPLTPEADLRYADTVLDRERGRLLAVREDHRGAGKEPVNTLVAVPLEGGEGQVLAEGFDFYASPRLSPDGSSLAWVCWNHPNMPWDTTELWLADVGSSGKLENARQIAGGEDESIVEPRWSPGGVLHFIADPSGWWNLYRLTPDGVEALCPRDVEFGAPAWQLGYATYGFESETTLLCSVAVEGLHRLARVDTDRRDLDWVDLPYPETLTVTVGEGFAGLLVISPTAPSAVARYDVRTGAFEVVQRSSKVDLDPAGISEGRAISYASAGGRTSHAFYYPPQSVDSQGANGEKPPLLVLSHGGPTGAAFRMLGLGTQFWTSRGFAVLDVNYGGSACFGRAYRETLKGKWGIVDVEDCIAGARHLVEQGEVDPHRLAIRGGSAGGFTTLAALTFHDVFQAGASHYGVSDLEALARDTHKFESRYLDGLVGPYPEAQAVYTARSPIHHVEGLSCPVILLQGLDDPVVPPNQAERMVDALKKKGIPVAYVPFEGEQHGFRQAANIRRALEAELYFYGRIFGFEPADPIEPVTIDNL